MLQLRDIAARSDKGAGLNTGFTAVLINITKRERATILATLRRWLSYPAAREADSIATGGGKYKPLDNAEIERVCKRITEIERKRPVSPLLHQSANGDGVNARIERKRAIAADRQHRMRSCREHNRASAH
jgi:hypothetical protein